MTDEQLLIGFAESGSQELFAELYRRLYAKTVYYLCKRGMNSERARDAAQEAFINVLNRASAFRGDARASTWIMTIARNCAISSQRLCSNRRMIQADDPRLFGDIPDYRQTVAEERQAADDHVDFMAAIDSLDQPQSAVVRLLDIEGMDYEGAAIELGIPVGTVRSRRHRALYRLRQLMAAVVLLALVFYSPLGGPL